MDYRDIGGRFDRIVSVEMIEAVGKARLPKFFEMIRTLLHPGGTCVLQVITIAGDRFESYCRAPDFIQSFISLAVSCRPDSTCGRFSKRTA
jgi:cyclopropane-fatty-acyl-phospholipid synthase